VLRVFVGPSLSALVAGPLNPLLTERLATITPATIKTWERGQAATGKTTQTARAYSLLKSILGEAVRDHRITSNPCHIRGAANATTGRKVEPPTREELAVILGTIAPHYRASIAIAARGGRPTG
jgi:hypothetical protein